MARAAGPAVRHQRWDERGVKIQAQKATDVITRRRCHAARESNPFCCIFAGRQLCCHRLGWTTCGWATEPPLGYLANDGSPTIAGRNR